MPQIIATPCPVGINMPRSDLSSVREITDDLPSDVIGECVTEATHKAWSAGFDPAIGDFCVIVTYR